jgi:hypothetical protein
MRSSQVIEVSSFYENIAAGYNRHLREKLLKVKTLKNSFFLAFAGKWFDASYKCVWLVTGVIITIAKIMPV